LLQVDVAVLASRQARQRTSVVKWSHTNQ
jgi:hypothetical protein